MVLPIRAPGVESRGRKKKEREEEEEEEKLVRVESVENHLHGTDESLSNCIVSLCR